MREILFRGRKDNGEWICGEYITIYDDPKYKAIKTCIELNTGIYEVEPETVGQYTGLTDKNGERIFEGDILLDTQSGEKVLMKWFEKYGCFAFANEKGFMEWEYTDIFIDDMAVIGNIFDNPELLKGDAEG